DVADQRERQKESNAMRVEPDCNQVQHEHDGEEPIREKANDSRGKEKKSVAHHRSESGRLVRIHKQESGRARRAAAAGGTPALLRSCSPLASRRTFHSCRTANFS